MSCETPDPSLRLLHVDDDAVNMMVLDQLLTSLGHRPVGVATAHEALELLRHETFDAVLSDIHMPALDGVALREQLAEHRPDLPVFAVTADVMTRTQQEYQRLGFAGVLAKPLTLQKLSELLSLVHHGQGSRPFFAWGIAKG